MDIFQPVRPEFNRRTEHLGKGVRKLDVRRQAALVLLGEGVRLRACLQSYPSRASGCAGVFTPTFNYFGFWKYVPVL
jgi:hypothetical protein